MQTFSSSLIFHMQVDTEMCYSSTTRIKVMQFVWHIDKHWNVWMLELFFTPRKLSTTIFQHFPMENSILRGNLGKMKNTTTNLGNERQNSKLTKDESKIPHEIYFIKLNFNFIKIFFSSFLNISLKNFILIVFSFVDLLLMILHFSFHLSCFDEFLSYSVNKIW